MGYTLFNMRGDWRISLVVVAVLVCCSTQRAAAECGEHVRIHHDRETPSAPIKCDRGRDHTPPPISIPVHFAPAKPILASSPAGEADSGERPIGYSREHVRTIRQSTSIFHPPRQAN